MQVLRNCGGRHNKAIIKVNQKVYRECPRALCFGRKEEEYLVSLYFDCRENKTWPYGASLARQTSYTKYLFDFLDGIVGEFRERQHKEFEQQAKKQEKKGRV